MTDLSLAPARTAAEPFAVLTATSAALVLLALLWSGFDARLVDGVEVWLKPLKFALSFVVHFGTLALFVRAANPATRDGRAIRVAASVMAAAFLGEMAYLFVQAAQAERSHFNLSTPFHEQMYTLMGIGAVLLIAMPVVVARAVATDPRAALGPATRSGMVWGAALSFVLTLVVAGYLSAAGGHLVGTPSPGAAGLPLVGWSVEVGDLRPAHFLSLHALQALPLLGLWLDRTGRDASLIRPAAGLWAALTLAVFVQALLGLPLIRL